MQKYRSETAKSQALACYNRINVNPKASGVPCESSYHIQCVKSGWLAGARAEERREARVQLDSGKAFKGVFTIKRCLGTNSERLSYAGAQVFPHCSDKLRIITELYWTRPEPETSRQTAGGRKKRHLWIKRHYFHTHFDSTFVTTKAFDPRVNMCKC